MGDIGPYAALPVMEGKAMLFKEFGGVDAFPICLDTQDVDRIVDTVCQLAPTYFAFPVCFAVYSMSEHAA
jgi:malate dehydrogenase (oxaloacetate-decarboxylating)